MSAALRFTRFNVTKTCNSISLIFQPHRISPFSKSLYCTETTVLNRTLSASDQVGYDIVEKKESQNLQNDSIVGSIQNNCVPVQLNVINLPTEQHHDALKFYKMLINPKRSKPDKCTIYWDFENMPIPSNLCLKTIISNLKSEIFKDIEHEIPLEIKVYARESQISSELENEFDINGVIHICVPIKKPQSVDMRIISDIDFNLYELERDHKCGAIALISGDSDFGYTLNKIRYEPPISKTYLVLLNSNKVNENFLNTAHKVIDISNVKNIQQPIRNQNKTNDTTSDESMNISFQKKTHYESIKNGIESVTAHISKDGNSIGKEVKIDKLEISNQTTNTTMNVTTYKSDLKFVIKARHKTSGKEYTINVRPKTQIKSIQAMVNAQYPNSTRKRRHVHSYSWDYCYHNGQAMDLTQTISDYGIKKNDIVIFSN
eukprot:475153_1